MENSFTKLAVSDIGYDDKRRINKLVIIDKSSGEVLYTYGIKSSAQKQDAKVKQKQEAPKQEQKPFIPPKAEEQRPNALVTTADTLPQANDAPEYLQIYRSFLKNHGIDKAKFAELRLKALQDKKEGITDKNFRELSSDEWIALLKAMEGLYVSGYYKDVA